MGGQGAAPLLLCRTTYHVFVSPVIASLASGSLDYLPSVLLQAYRTSAVLRRATSHELDNPCCCGDEIVTDNDGVDVVGQASH